ncbi:MAG: DUF2207 domain-containing protein [Halanaerobiaceae bacterium]
MKSKNKLLLIFFILMIVICFTIQARDYHFPLLEIDLYLQEDGSIRVIENRSIQFQGKFTGFYQEIITDGEFKIDNIVVKENGIPYERNHSNTPGPEGTYFIEENNERVLIDWSYSAENEVRTFTLEYDLYDTILVHEDIAEFYYKFIGDGWDKPTEEVFIKLHLPGEVESIDDIRAWGHGPLHGDVNILNKNTISWEVKPLLANNMLEGRVTFPVELVPAANRFTNRIALPGILEEEQSWADEANRQRVEAQEELERQKAREEKEVILAILIIFLSIIIASIFWNKYGKEFKADFQGEYYRELPNDYSPAELGVLWRMGTINVEDLTATLIDLARRKYLKIEEYEREIKGVFKTSSKIDYKVTRLENDGTLQKHEKIFLDFLYEEVDKNDSGEITFFDLEKFSAKHKSKFQNFWEKWKNAVSKEVEKYNFFDKTVSSKQTIEILLGVFVFILSFPLFYYNLTITAVSTIIAGFIIIIAGIFIRRRSKAGANDYARWKAFRKYISHFSNISEYSIPSLVIWEHYLVYAITLGVAKEVIKQLELVYPDLQEDNYRFGYGWYYMNARGLGAFNQSVESMASTIQNSFQNSLATATSSSSSGSGSGGGFSSGGGGGFGGGGGGAS